MNAKSPDGWMSVTCMTGCKKSQCPRDFFPSFFFVNGDDEGKEQHKSPCTRKISKTQIEGVTRMVEVGRVEINEGEKKSPSSC